MNNNSKERQYNFHLIKYYFEIISDKNYINIIDDTTVSDLDLHGVFEKIDKTQTSVGQAYLYRLLRTQCINDESFKERKKRILFYKNENKLSIRTEKYLKKVGFQQNGNITNELWEYYPTKERNYLFILRIWFIISLGIFFSPILLGFLAVLYIILPICIINIFIYIRTKPLVSLHASNLFYLFKLIWLAGKITKKLPGEMLDEFKELKNIYSIIKPLQKKIIFFQPSQGFVGDNITILIEYFKVFLLSELRAFISTYHKIGKYLHEFRRLYEILGSIDAYISLMKIINEKNGICMAECKLNEESIIADKITHPLIKNCIENTIRIDTGVIITGTNMSGKSTFLRTFGINQILAISLCMAFASEFKTNFYCTFTSIVNVDNLLEKKSKYFVEAQRLLEIIQKSKNNDTKTILLIDEMLAGTNSEDRIKASISILKNLINNNIKIVTVTHDLIIAKTLNNLYENYHFEEEITNDNIIFDFTLKKGIVNQKNAIRLLEYLGYPDEIISELLKETNN